MHFFVFMFLFIMIAVSLGLLLYIVCDFLKDANDMQWQWLPVHLGLGLTVALILCYFVNLMTKFANA